MKSCIRVLLISCILSQPVLTFGQSALTPIGGNIAGSGGSVSYTLGQIGCKTLTGSGGKLNEGVQHSYEIYVATAIDEFKNIELTFSSYPNPTHDLLKLKVGIYCETMKLSYWLYGVNGNLIENKRIYTPESEINLAKQQPGTFYLKVTSEKMDLITFKIIKN